MKHHTINIGDMVKCIMPTCILELNKIYEVIDITDANISVMVDGEETSYCMFEDGSKYNRFEKVPSIDFHEAKDARKKTNEVIRVRILNSIQKYINKGEFSVTIDNVSPELAGSIKDELLEKGYKVYPFQHRLMVSWY